MQFLRAIPRHATQDQKIQTRKPSGRIAEMTVWPMAIRFFPLACFVSAIVIAGPASVGFAQQKYHLQYQFTPGEILRYEVTNKSTYSAQTDTFSETSSNVSHVKKHFRVVSVDADGSAVLESTIDQVKQSVSFNGGEATIFDSTSEKSVPKPFQQIAKSVGKPLGRLRFSSTGKLLAMSRIQTASGTQADAAEAQRSAQQGFLIQFPDAPLQVGDVWKERMQVPVRVGKQLTKPFEILRTYQLAGVKEGLAEIQLKTSILTPMNAPQEKVQLMQRPLKGTILFDIRRGRIVSRKLQNDQSVYGASGAKSVIRATMDMSESLVEKGT